MQEYGNVVGIACNKSGVWFDELQSSWLLIYELPCKRNPLRISNLIAYQYLKKIVKQNKYDLIYCQQPVGGLLGRSIGNKYKIPVFYTYMFFYKGCKFVN